MATEGFVSGASGEEISLIVDGIKVAALQNLSWKASQSKKVVRGAGFKKPHAMGRGPKEYELDFEISELNIAVLGELPTAEQGDLTQISSFVVGNQVFTSLLDLRDCLVMVMYPPKNNYQRVLRFKGFEFTEDSGGYSVDDEIVNRKLSGIAMDAEGLV
jgi:hypothetical protein